MCCKTALCKGGWDKHGGHLNYRLCAHRYTGSMNLSQALKENMGDAVNKRRSDTSLSLQVGRSHSSEERSVMDKERRASVI
ncbi:MAG: hypothetical protein H0U39_03495 [Segetibacter sp.]|nr:hypothetical protein [Segetibacter sp.]